MTDRTNAQGYFILEKHAVIRFSLQKVKQVSCIDLDMMPAIIFGLNISRSGEQISIEWESSYGLSGLIAADHVSIAVTPGKPD